MDDRRLTLMERIDQRAAELETLVRAARETVDIARLKMGHAMDRGHRLEHQMMVDSLDGKPTHGKFSCWLRVRSVVNRHRQVLRLAADELAERQRAWAVFAGAACDLARGQASLEEYML